MTDRPWPIAAISGLAVAISAVVVAVTFIWYSSIRNADQVRGLQTNVSALEQQVRGLGGQPVTQGPQGPPGPAGPPGSTVTVTVRTAPTSTTRPPAAPGGPGTTAARPATSAPSTTTTRSSTLPSVTITVPRPGKRRGQS